MIDEVLQHPSIRRPEEIGIAKTVLVELQKRQCKQVTALQLDGSIMPKMIWKIDGFLQASLARTVNIGQLTVEMWERNEAIAAILLARAIMEMLANTDDFVDGLAHRIEKGVSLKEIDDYVMDCCFASRSIEGFPRAVNITTKLQKMDKKIKGFFQHYERLSETCHPNYAGNLGGCSELDKKNYIINIVAPSERGIEMMDNDLPVAAGGSLEIFVCSIDNYYKNLRPVLLGMCEKDLG